MTDVRTRIAVFVTDHPGAYFSELVRELDLAPGQVQYHLRRLQDDDALVERSLYGCTHYVPPEYGDWESSVLALSHREREREILRALVDRGPARPAAVASTLGVARSTLEWHLTHLLEQEVVEKRRDGHNHVTLSLTRPSTTEALLETAATEGPS